MTATRLAEPPVAPAEQVAVPSPGRGRYALLVVVLLLAGGFAGNLLHLQFFQASWLEALGVCSDSVNRSPGDTIVEIIAKHEQEVRCQAPVERRRGLVVLGGAVLVLLLGLGLMQWLPSRLFRRAGPMRLAPAEWQDMGDEAVRSLGGRGRPEVYFGPFRLGEAFTVRFRRRTRIVLPPAVRILPVEQAAAIVRHESAHVVAGDVGLVWLTRGVLWALPPVLVLPFVLAAAEGVFAADTTFAQMVWQPFWIEYAIRAAVLLLLTVVVSSSVLRSREHEADLRSVQGHSAEALRMLLGRSAERSGSLWRRSTAPHPSFARRLAVLDRGDLITHAPAIEGIAFGVLAAMTLQATQFLLMSPLLTATPLAPYTPLLGSLLTGTLLAFGWGIAVWRFALALPTGMPVNRAGTLLGLPVGVALGLLIDFSQIGATDSGPFGLWPIMVTVPLMVAGAGGLSLALAASWARCRGAVPTPAWMWPLVALANVALFVAAVWLGQTSGAFVALDGWFSGYVETGLRAPSVELVAISLAGVGVLAWWWADRRLHLLATCVLSVAIAVAGRLLLPIAIDRPTPVQLASLDWWVAAAAGIGCLLGLLVVRGGAGLGRALAAAPVAALLTATVTLALARLTEATGLHRYTSLNNGQTLVWYSQQSLFLVALTLFIVALPAAMLPSREREMPRWVLPVSSMVFTALLVVVVMWLGDRVTVE